MRVAPETHHLKALEGKPVSRCAANIERDVTAPRAAEYGLIDQVLESRKGSTAVVLTGRGLPALILLLRCLFWPRCYGCLVGAVASRWLIVGCG